MASSSKRTREISIAGVTTPFIDIVIYDDTRPTPPKRGAKRRKKAIPPPITFRVDTPLPSEPSAVASSSTCSHVQPSTPEENSEESPSQAEGVESMGPADDAPVHEGADEPRSAKKNTNDYLREWLLNECEGYVDVLYGRDSPPESEHCDSCLKGPGPKPLKLYRCTTCLGLWSHCAECLVANHRTSPTHRIEVWDEMVWVESSLADLKLVVHLGHRGRECEASKSEENTEFYVGDLNGFTRVLVRYCTHEGAPSKSQQLLAAGLFPCSDSRRQSAFTLSLLDTFNIFTTLGRTSAHKYYSVLERVTKPGFPSDVKDHYREMMATHRRFLHVSNLKRSGHNFRPHPTDVLPGDQAMECVACPRPGWNFEWSEVIEGERVWFRPFISYDGNFRSVRKIKKVSSGDMCLSDGLAYFVLKAPYKAWTESETHPQRTEKPACDNHKAGNDTGVRWVGQDVTGIGVFTCTSHSWIIPRGMVDYFKGERFIYTDYAFASAVRYLTRLGPLAFGMTYDVWCHWIINFHARAQNLPCDIALPEQLDLVGAIPKWHLVGHDPSCYVRWSLDHMQYVGRMEGEGVERVWAHMNEHSGSTSEQGPGVRTDNLNNMAGQWNFEKMITMHRALPPKFIEAKRMMLKQRDIHDDLSSSLLPETVAEWKNVPLEPSRGPNGKWTSPLADPLLTNGSFQSEIQAGREMESSTTRVAGKRPGATRWISDGIELEHSMRKVNDEAKDIGRSPTPRQANELNKKRMALYERVLEHNKKGLLYMPQLDEPDHPDHNPPADDAPESMELCLPLSYQSATLAAAGLASLGEQEKKLRRGMCNDALESVKYLLGARAAAFSKRQGKGRGEVSGQIAVTRAKASIHAHSAKISKARWRYHNSRSALMRLGASADDFRTYLELKDEDLTPLKSFLDDDSRGVGQGYKSISWIWRNNAVPNVQDWQVNALRTEWFRSRERYKRWEEQLVLLKREMVMAIRSFLKRAEVWEWKASFADPKSGMRVYATKCSRFYGTLARQMFKACKDSLYDDVVTLQWSDVWLKKNATLFDNVINSHK